MALFLRPKRRALGPTTSLRFFSSNLEPPNSQSTPTETEKPQATSPFSDIKSSLKDPQSGSLFSRTGKSTSSKFDEIGKQLAEFRRQSAASSTRSPITFQSLQNRNLLNDNNSNSTFPTSSSGSPSRIPFESIRDSLQKMRINSPNIQPRTNNNSTPKRGVETPLPAPMFRRDRMERGEKKEVPRITGFIRNYTPTELGEKLRKLRPEGRTGKWFSLKELSERVGKLKEIEVKEMESRPDLNIFKDLRDVLEKQKQDDDEKARTGMST